MKRLLWVIALGSAAACIEWPSDELIRANRCLVEPNECSFDAGPGDAGPGDAGSDDAGLDAGTDAGADDAGTDAGADDAGTDAGADDAGTDAGVASWTRVWSLPAGFPTTFVVGDQTGGTVVRSTATGNFALRGFSADGGTGATISPSLPPVTAAYESQGLLVVGFADRTLRVWRRSSSTYTSIAVSDAGFVTTAVDLYPLPTDGGPAVAAYGNFDGGLGLLSYEAHAGRTLVGELVVPCDTTVMRPHRILPTPDGGPGVVVGNVDGACFGNLNFNATGGGGFVARFGFPIQDGYSFTAEPNAPMALGIFDGDLWLAYRPQAGTVALANVSPTGLVNSVPVLSGDLTPVELVDVGAELLLVGHGVGTIALIDGGLSTSTLDDDVFIARLGVDGEVRDLSVFIAPGNQRVAGAVWMNGRLVMGGSCDLQAGLCDGPGQGWLAGFEPTP